MAENAGPGRGRGRARGRARVEEAPTVRQPGQAPPQAWGPPHPAQQPGQIQQGAGPRTVQPPAPQGAWGRATRPQAPQAAAGPVGRAPVEQMAAMNLGAAAAGNGSGGDRPTAGTVGRGASRGGRAEARERFEIIKTRPEKTGFTKKGAAGTPCSLMTNYFKVTQVPDIVWLQYRVDFSPDEDRTAVRKALLRNQESVIGKHIFDGTILYCVRRMQNEVTELFGERASDGEKIRITLRFTKEVHREDYHFWAILNNILRRCTYLLGLKLLGRDYYDDQAKHVFTVQNTTLEVWPGYKTAIRAHESNILLLVDIIHKVLRKDTAYNVFFRAVQEAHARNRDVKLAVKAALEGAVVITFYNNEKTFRVDDIDLEASPKSTFHLRKENRDVSYIEYYKMRYNIDIRDQNQPLLISRPTRRDLNRGDDEPIRLIPELCFMTGLTDDMRRDFTLMKAVGDYTRETPNQRVDQLIRYRQRLAATKAIQEEFKNWGLELSTQLEKVEARRLGPEKIITGGGSFSYDERKGDWSNELKTLKMASTVDLNRWVVLCPKRMEGDGKNFVSMMRRVAGPMGIALGEPVWIGMPADRAINYTTELKGIVKQQPTFSLCFMWNPNEMNYAAIKKQCYVDNPMLNQVVTGKAMKKGMSAATKVVIQVAAKVGAVPWMVEIPPKDLMVIGFDAHHDARQRRAFGAFIFSLNPALTRYGSSVTRHENNEELGRSMEVDILKALTLYGKENKGRVPGKIVFYRDAMGAGDITRIRESEVAALKRGLEEFARRHNMPKRPQLIYIIVTKRINTRFFESQRQGYCNPPPGTVVDNVVTLYERFDFFLVSQKANQGTVSPTSYHIIEDEVGWAPDLHQRLAYKLTHLYYNWPGTLSVPAPIQYAHTCAYKAGETLKQPPHPDLDMTPYFL